MKWFWFEIKSWFCSHHCKIYTWSSPNQFEGLQTESLLIKEWFLKLISNSALDHPSIILHFYFILASFAATHPPTKCNFEGDFVTNSKNLTENREQSNKTPKNSSQKLMWADLLFFFQFLVEECTIFFKDFQNVRKRKEIKISSKVKSRSNTLVHSKT